MSNKFYQYHKSYVYRFTNIINNRWYIGSRWKYEGDPKDDPYLGSSHNKEYWRDQELGLMKKEVICEFTLDQLPIKVSYDGISLIIDDVVTLALWVEDQLIKSGWRIHGKSSSYNLRTQFLNNIKVNESSSSDTAKSTYASVVSANGGKHPMIDASNTPEAKKRRYDSNRDHHDGKLAWITDEALAHRSESFLKIYGAANGTAGYPEVREKATEKYVFQKDGIYKVMSKNAHGWRVNGYSRLCSLLEWDNYCYNNNIDSKLLID